MSKQIEYQLTEHYSFRISKIQYNTLEKLKYKYKIDISNFIRLAIKEKIEREYPMLKEKINPNKLPF